jgi:hypothetical protein
LATVARADRTTTTTRYLAVFNSSEWERGRKEWYPSTLKSPVAAGRENWKNSDLVVGMVQKPF